MDRNIVYPGSVPLDTDILTLNRNVMTALGYLAQATLGTGQAVDGLACSPTSPASLAFNIGPGSITELLPVDTLAYGSLAAVSGDMIVKMGVSPEVQTFSVQPPTTPGNSVCYLLQASFQESDQGLTVLTYFNPANPAQPLSGPTNSGVAQATRRVQYVQLQMKGGVPSSTGTQVAPSADNGWTGLYVITVAFAQTTITAADITTLPGAPFLTWKLPQLKPGFGTGVQTFSSNATFVVPAGVTQLEVELWGGGAGSFASTSGTGGGPGVASGGGSGGGYSRKRITGLTPGQSISVLVGAGGGAGLISGVAPTAGGVSSFGQFASATGGGLNYLSTLSTPQFGATPPGVGVGGDVNLTGSAGQAGIGSQGGMGGGAPMGGAQNSGTTGVVGTSPGGGAAGAGTGANGATAYNGAAGASGLVVVRW